VNAALKYTLGRIGLLVLAVLVLLPLRLNIFLTLMIALLASMLLSYFLLRRWREEFAAEIVQARRQRRDQKERLRAALAGEDEAGDAPPVRRPESETVQTDTPPEAGPADSDDRRS
jgi:hypothetical protein